MKRLAVLAVAVAACPLIVSSAWGHADHPVPSFSAQGPLSTTLNAGGRNAQWELVTSIPTGNPHTDLDFFTSGGETFASVGTLADGPNAGGQTIIQLTQGGEVRPRYVTGHPSASCLSAATGITGLQHDAEAAPKGNTILNVENPFADRRDAQVVVDATDAPGRCHDQGVLGASAVPQGGLEIIDVTDPTKPKEIGLTTHVGQSHTVNVDPKRPHIAYSVTSDTTTVGSDGRRANENSGNALDGFEVVDMSSCMNFPAGTTIEQKRDACRPQVYRYRWNEPGVANSSRYPNVVGACHEVEIYPDDRLACASLMATVLFDMGGAFDDGGTPNDFSDDKPRGTPLPCRVRDTSTAVPTFRTGAKVTDCVVGEGGQSLTVAEWLKIGSPSLEGVQRLGTIHHMGFENQQQNSVQPAYDSKEDIFVSHEAELTGSGNFLLVTDERGGGVLPGGATCSPGVDNEIGNGGIHAYPVSKLKTQNVSSVEEAWESYARTSDGGKAIYRAPTRTQPQGSVCTSHLLQQIPGQNRIFMAWYSQATQVLDFVENPDGTIDFKEVGWFIPQGANQWVSAIFKVEENSDGSFTYWGATGDFALSGTGRNGIDVYKVTLPPPAQSYGDTDFEQASLSGSCARAAGFDAVGAGTKGRGVRFRFQERGGSRVRVRLFRKSRGRAGGARTVIKRKLVRDFGRRARSFRWRGGRKLKRGYYYVEFKTRAPNGSMDRRRIGLRKEKGGFRRLRPFERWTPCGLVQQARLTSPVFGGRRDAPLRLRFSLEETSDVTIAVRRKGKLVKRYPAESYGAGRNHRVTLDVPRNARRGEYKVKLMVNHPGRASEVRLVGRKLP